MNKYLVAPMVCVLFGSLAGCTTEKHYDSPPQTVIHEDRTSAADTNAGTREAAREGARDGVRDPYR
jgi:predicted component of type VI protein secretion system